MNIFVLDVDPRTSAQMMCDKHVVKMVLETAQMMCTVVSSFGYETPYRPTHAKHPCTLWAAGSYSNWRWLAAHGLALCEEYTHRYNKKHKSERVIRWCLEQSIHFPQAALTPFAQAMPDKYRNPSAVTAYRTYYQNEKAAFATWKTSPPPWWPEKGGFLAGAVT